METGEDGKREARLLVFEAEMDEPRLVRCPDGEAYVYSRRNPEAERANQDSALVVVTDAGRGLLAVADGMGGMPGGCRAARIAIEALAAAAHDVGATAEGGDLRSRILDAVEHANGEIAALGIGAATTLAVVELEASRVRPYHVGDSAILLVGQRGKIKLQSVPHSPTGYAVEAGFLDEDEALAHSDRHVVSNVVGEEAMRIEVGSSIELSRRDTLLVASDGLTDNLTVAQIVELIRKGPLEQAARSLVRQCAERMASAVGGGPGKPDDMTLVLYRREGPAESP